MVWDYLISNCMFILKPLKSKSSYAVIDPTARTCQNSREDYVALYEILRPNICAKY